MLEECSSLGRIQLISINYFEDGWQTKERTAKKYSWCFQPYSASPSDQFGYLCSFVAVVFMLCRICKYASILYINDMNVNSAV